ncbi:MAG: serine/threonine-protein kinase, partial [Solirubrobacteraceae bacterium]
MSSTRDLSGSALDGRYELHALIGEGAFGRVYRGLDRRLARPVAVKLIKPWWAEDDAWVERFQREAQLLARVSDPGIVQIYDIGHADSGPYYVAELVDGESLAKRLRRGALAPTEARAIGEQLCDALAGAHLRGIVHCDVKPANVLITASGKVKVGDFGVARLAEGTSQAPSATVAGTPRYMSPEQARGRPTGPATDVYSAGVVLYEMLAGEPPFAHGSPVELGLRHVQEQPPRLSSEVPAALREVVERALEKDPGERFRDGAAMAAALRAAAPSPRAAAGAPGLDGAAAGEIASSGALPRAREGGEEEGEPAGSAAAGSAEAATVDRSTAPTVLASSAATRVMGRHPGALVGAPPRAPAPP